MPRSTQKAAKAAAAAAVSTSVVEYGRHRGTRRVRLDATMWVDAGIEILVRESIEHISVERVARDLGVTKGSFYWHFKDRADLQTAMLDRWIKKATVEVRERLEREKATTPEKLLSLLELPFWSPRAEHAADLELAIRGWARRSPLARRAVQRVDRIRLGYLSELFESLGLDAREALARAHQAYALTQYLGQLRDTDQAEMHRIIASAHASLLGGVSPRKSSAT